MKSIRRVNESIRNYKEIHKKAKNILRFKKKFIKLHSQKKMFNYPIINNLKFDEDEICLIPSSMIVFEDDIKSIITLSDL